MDNKHIIDIIIKDAQEIESLANSFGRFSETKVPPIFIDLTMSKVKNLYTELQMLNKSNDELYDIMPIEKPAQELTKQSDVKPEKQKEDEVKVFEAIKTATTKHDQEKEVKNKVEKKEQTEEEKIEAEKSAYEDLVQKREEHFLATQLKFEGIKNIKEEVSLTEKIWFIKELFDGSIDNFNKTVEILNNCEYLEEALDHIDDNFKWDYENQTVRDFMEYVYRRFF